MFARPSAHRTLPNLAMPLRDALRGVATLADATEDMLEPAAQLLPEPLRARFRAALDQLEAAGKRLIHAPIEPRQIATAAGVLSGRAGDAGAIDTCAAVLAYAWDHLGETPAEHRSLISETIVADRLTATRAGSTATGYDFAATALVALRQSTAVGRMPGLARGTTAQEDREMDRALLAIAVWLLSGRADSLAEEEKLLDLSLALVRALRDDAADLFSAPSALATFLADTSDHL